MLSVQEVKTSDQYITCEVKSKDGKLSCLITAVYALNHNVGRKALWEELLSFKKNVVCPWLMGEDFNAIISSDEKIGGFQVTDTDTDDFQSFVTASQLNHIKTTGCFFTWSNKQNADTRVWSRLDRTLVNENWIHNYTTSQVEYLMPLCSDHSPSLMTIGDENFDGKKPFKFFSMWSKHPDFPDVVRSVWSQNVRGYNMYKFYSKLRNLKHVLKDLNKKNFMDINQQVLRAKSDLCSIQEKPSSDLFNPDLISKEKDCIKKYAKLLECENSFYRQKANIKWGLHADKGSQFFHSIMKSKRHQNRVLSLYTKNGTRITELPEITSEFVQYYKNLLGNAKATIAVDPRVISNGRILTSIHRRELSSPVSRDEIKQALFSMSDSKAPGPDGFNGFFFKAAWNVINEDLFLAVEEFFDSGKLLGTFNTASITLVPKTLNPSSSTDFRPISSCNVIYKIISKIIASRMQKVMGYIVNDAQSAFVKGRLIFSNFLLAHELIKQYGRKNNSLEQF
ncbi:uncharacterized protein LOC109820765 [Asparagus officinalis]|uniref:uncharacterized protein LOC109820765 n=1 Tax=Asparagus officinalis TaxID=4686 RepID=UPI00098E13A2|nr:uncharacterized protein LOC109820765 [Asparagus officinalis]